MHLDVFPIQESSRPGEKFLVSSLAQTNALGKALEKGHIENQVGLTVQQFMLTVFAPSETKVRRGGTTMNAKELKLDYFQIYDVANRYGEHPSSGTI